MSAAYPLPDLPEESSGAGSSRRRGTRSSVDRLGPPDLGGLEFDGGGGGEHLGWRISALLDNELSVPEAMVARDHLASCDYCQAEFAEVMAARSMVRELGVLEPPSGFVDGIVTRARRRRTSMRLGLVALFALALIWIVGLVVATLITLPEVTPPVQTFVERASFATTNPEAMIALPETQQLALDEDADAFAAPSSIGEYELDAAFEQADGIQLLYRPTSGQGPPLSIFEQEGILDWDSLPDGEHIETGDRSYWSATLASESGDSFEVAVTPGGSVTYTVVAPEGADVESIVPALPDS